MPFAGDNNTNHHALPPMTDFDLFLPPTPPAPPPPLLPYLASPAYAYPAPGSSTPAWAAAMEDLLQIVFQPNPNLSTCQQHQLEPPQPQQPFELHCQQQPTIPQSVRNVYAHPAPTTQVDRRVEARLERGKRKSSDLELTGAWVDNSLPQIAIKRKDNKTMYCAADTEVVLLNGNWDTSNRIPNIIAEMHNVNLADLQRMQATLPIKNLQAQPYHSTATTIPQQTLGTTGTMNQYHPAPTSTCASTSSSHSLSPLTTMTSTMPLDAPLVVVPPPTVLSSGGHGFGGGGGSANGAGDVLVGGGSAGYLTNCASPMGSDSGIEGDCTDGNLSWLLNYKINELPPVPDTQTEKQIVTNIGNQQYTIELPANFGGKQVFLDGMSYSDGGESSVVNTLTMSNPSGGTVVLDSRQQPSLCQAAAVMGTAGAGTAPPIMSTISPPQPINRYAGPSKPPFTYTELIEHALIEKGELTVSGIYQWISDHFTFYKQNDDRWKNSVRHNLSINPHFRKGGKAAHGAGHLWTIAQRDESKTWSIRQRMQEYMEMNMLDNSKDRQRDLELETATASIMPPDAVLQGEYMSVMTDPSNSGEQENIEVEYVIDVSNNLDFLCPISKEQVVQECGLGNDFLITDLNPNTLGLNLAEAEIIAGSMYDDLNMHCYELTTE